MKTYLFGDGQTDEINGSKVVNSWPHCQFPTWSIHQTEDKKFWLDTDPKSDGNCSELSEREARKAMSGEAKILIQLSQEDLIFPNGDTYDEDRLVDAICKFAENNYPLVPAVIGIARSGSQYSELGREVALNFFEQHGTDPELFV